MLEKVLQIYRQLNLKVNKNKCLFRCASIPFFGKMISWQGVSLNSSKIQALMDMSTPRMKKELQSFIGILSYLCSFSPMAAEVSEPLPKLASVKLDWTWNMTYQDLYQKARTRVKRNICMKFYDAARPLYLETDASGIGLVVRLLK